MHTEGANSRGRGLSLAVALVVMAAFLGGSYLVGPVFKPQGPNLLRKRVFYYVQNQRWNADARTFVCMVQYLFDNSPVVGTNIALPLTNSLSPVA